MEEKYSPFSKIISTDKLDNWLSVQRFKQKKIVFTNGCFDILHRGHVDYLYKASMLGDCMILGLNTDESIKRIKGEQRPIADELSRSHVMASLEFIDCVVLFNEDTPYELIRTIQPDILVKGDDYTIKNIVGADIVLNKGGSVETISLVEGYSTTSLIEKIKKL